MASSSSINHTKSYKYDVFLSFRGEDTRKTFVDHLYAALDQQGICTFKDDERLEKGKEIKDDLLQSIEDSRLYIIVFSKSYASSSWCLNELLKIMECHKTKEHFAFPVFYDVDPSEVRKQNGLVGEAIAKHKDKSEAEVGKWRGALTEAANLSGWDVRNIANGHEAKVIKIIVARVSLELRPIDINVDDDLVGMEQRMKALDPFLEIGVDDVRMIGIKGMGGAGKTTLARAIFDKISNSFEGISFVENVRENSKAHLHGLQKLQEHVLRDLLKDNNINVRGVYEGKNLMKKKLCGKKVLVILDDVDQKDQLEALAGDLAWFKAGSRIIITTRDEEVLEANRVKRIHDVNLLSEDEAICLLSRHAFGRDTPTQEYEKHSREVISYAAGLPLTIKVLGSDLCGKDDSEWAYALERLKTIPLKETLKILELSYENLEDDYKEIFLDVACFLRGWRKDNAIRMLESCGFYAKYGLRVLEKKSLITYGATINIHDHLVEMGKNIIRRAHADEPYKHSRMWIQEEIERVLASDSVTQATRCVGVRITPNIVLEGLGNMEKLRCLIVNYENYTITNDCVDIIEARQYFPNSLRYLYWKGYPHWCFPERFEADNLVGLEMPYSGIKSLWEGGKVMKKLKFLNLSFLKLRSLDLGLTPNLERLDLEYCFDLVKLYVYGGCIKTLVYLNLRGCTSLKSCAFIKEFESLEALRISRLGTREFSDYIIKGHSNNSLLELHLWGSDIEEVHLASIGNNKLVSLSLNNCFYLKSLPGSICSLQHLRTLDLQDSVKFEELPEDLGQLESLEDLDLSKTCVKNLPRSICMLKRLKTLSLRYCKQIEKLPEDIGQLESLEELYLPYCSSLRDIPNSICKLKRLRKLNLCGCERLEKLPDDLGDLECLQSLDIECTAITHLPQSISLLKGLNICRSEQIPDDDFIQLCSKYDSEKGQIQGFQHLRFLDLTGCGIEEVPEALGHLECLEELDLSATDVKHLPDSICMLKNLKHLALENCVYLEKLPDNVSQLESLEGLYLTWCYSIREIPYSICLLKQLKILDLYHCFCLEKLPEDVGELESLEELWLSRCYNIREIPNSICKLKHLRKLELDGCRRLEKLPVQIGDLECLQELTFWETAISYLPQSISLLNGLKIYAENPNEPNHDEPSEDLSSEDASSDTMNNRPTLEVPSDELGDYIFRILESRTLVQRLKRLNIYGFMPEDQLILHPNPDEPNHEEPLERSIYE